MTFLGRIYADLRRKIPTGSQTSTQTPPYIFHERKKQTNKKNGTFFLLFNLALAFFKARRTDSLKVVAYYRFSLLQTLQSALTDFPR